MATEILERRAAITGLGQSDVGRRLMRDPLELTLDACLAAIEDAGLAREDIDGLATYPGAAGGPAGFSGAGITDVQDALRLELSWYEGGMESPGQLGSVINACMAVATGLASHVLGRQAIEQEANRDEFNQGPRGYPLGHAVATILDLPEHAGVAAQGEQAPQ